MARVGKIARLSRFRREHLNQRLDDGEAGKTLVQWLNEQRDVQAVLAEHFHGKLITEQNLSEWKQGGYQEWLRHQDTRAQARSFLAEAEELEEEIDSTSLLDRVTEVAGVMLVRLLHEADAEKGPNRRAGVLEILREMDRLRRGDHDMDRVRIQNERWEAEQNAAHQAEMEKMKEKADFLNIKTQVIGNMLWKEYSDGMADGTLTPERAAAVRKHFDDFAERLRKCGVPDLPSPDSSVQSEQIQPNPAKSDL